MADFYFQEWPVFISKFGRKLQPFLDAGSYMIARVGYIGICRQRIPNVSVTSDFMSLFICLVSSLKAQARRLALHDSDGLNYPRRYSVILEEVITKCVSGI
ncbi:MAG: hypothetical protein K1W02_00115 [Muribaculaceae bacterium]